MPASPTYQIDLSLAPATIEALVDGGYSFYTMFAVQMKNAAARPTIGFSTQNITANMPIVWKADVSAYTSFTPISSGSVVRIGYEVPINIGQTFVVTSGGIGQVKACGPVSKIAIANTTAGAFTSGFARALCGEEAAIPIYAVPLYGNQTNIAAPLPKVLLQFTTASLQPGTLIEKLAMEFQAGASYSPSLLVEAAANQTRALSYDINAGWNWGAYSWAEIIPVNADLAKVLIVQE
ncbi:hypothetical protein [Phyllobacterium sp. OV277]|uniref:hypothetical protein n=1 Tax=Phyllobacterium sp. OV277 TaxID=1882772 RepID=UPI000885B304|nr:hypothetical protein [Phyllobacterium sp. OV277]SDP69942.1 hypothetical protein SAMN05443582_10881 [Phyllobacterium sp. OV277]